MRPIRAQEVDAIRGLALFGICVVNVPFLALPMESLMSSPEAFSDFSAAFLVEVLFQGKFFILFSFLFGWGFAIQIASAQRTGAGFGARYARRLLGLLVIGIAHALLVFIGDILVLYALLGAALYPMRNLPPRTLMRIAGFLVAVSAIALAILGVLVSEIPVELGASSSLPTSFFGMAGHRAEVWPFAFSFIMLFNGPMALAAFCAGLAAAKVEFFEIGSRSYRALRNRAPILLVAGLVFNLGYALASNGAMGEGLLALVSFMGLAVGGPCLSAIYLVAAVELSRRNWFQGATQAAGRMSLTAYVSEGILAGLIFNGYGLGLFGTMGHLALLGVAAAIYIAVHGFAALWLRHFARGPLEAVLRRLTRG